MDIDSLNSNDFPEEEDNESTNSKSTMESSKAHMRLTNDQTTKKKRH